MADLRTDAQLVTAYLAGDRDALAGIYDRFSPGLYDTAAAMLRDRHEAADAMQDVFLLAAERLGQLREPERLKPWLYAILRNEVYRRSRRRGRALPTDFSAMGGLEMAAPIAPDAEGEALSAAELADLVRSAACGLDERDQLVLELSVRQGLQGAELAAALGVTAEQSYTLVHRMRERVERSLGALVVAKAGRKECRDLDDILRGWNGEFSVLIRKRVARHLEHCETCEETKKRAAPLALIGSGTAFAAPPDLRSRILQLAGTPGAAPKRSYTFDSDGGFPRLVRHLRWPFVLLASLIAVLVGVGGGAIVGAVTDDGGNVPAAAPTTVLDTTVDTTLDTVLATTPTTTLATTTTLLATSTSTAPAPGALATSATVIDLGATDTLGSITLRNDGASPLDWHAEHDLAPFVPLSTSGTLAPGATHRFKVTLDRANMPEGDLARTVDLVAGDGTRVTIKLRARVEHPPVVKLGGHPFGSLCLTGGANLDLSYSDESGIAKPIVVTWSGPASGSNQLKDRGLNTSYGAILLSSIASSFYGTYNFSITVYDLRGNSTTVGDTFTIPTNCALG